MTLWQRMSSNHSQEINEDGKGSQLREKKLPHLNRLHAVMVHKLLIFTLGPHLRYVMLTIRMVRELIYVISKYSNKGCSILSINT
jgi:hypothetical protein